MGRYDADYATLLINHGKDSFSTESLNGAQIRGQVRHIKKINVGGYHLLSLQGITTARWLYGSENNKAVINSYL